MIEKIVNLDLIKSIFEFGAGNGSLLEIFNDKNHQIKLYANEISDEAINIIKKKRISNLIEISNNLNSKLPYNENYFDLAVLSHVLEHIEDENLVLTEVKRISKKLYIEIPLENNYFIDKNYVKSSKYGHINFYNLNIILSLLKNNNLNVLDYKIFTNSLKYEIYYSGYIKGFFKNLTKKFILILNKKIATKLFTYNVGILCE
jgi:ubiquinone/menaquinone biosynthesis C-methylase UbiE